MNDQGTPVVAFCGFSNSGKTTLLEAVIPELRARGLAIAVVKHDAHGVDIDHPGKDSDRLFRAGATVVLRGADESAARWHPDDEPTLSEALANLGSNHDLVLVEGHKQTPLPKLWLLGEDGGDPPADVEGILGVLPRNESRPSVALEMISTHLDRCWLNRRFRAGILIGGKSSRMGSPKQLVSIRGKTLAETVVDSLSSVTDDVVLMGSGPVPEALGDLPRLPDAPRLSGPLGAFVSAQRWDPSCVWLMVACDQPAISREALSWLLDQRRPGRWAILPRLGDGKLEPLLAIYEPQAGPLLGRLAGSGSVGPWRIVDHPSVADPVPPKELWESWRSIDTPEDLEEFSG